MNRGQSLLDQARNASNLGYWGIQDTEDIDTPHIAISELKVAIENLKNAIARAKASQLSVSQTWAQVRDQLLAELGAMRKAWQRYTPLP